MVKELQGVESALFLNEGLKFIEYMADKLTKEQPCALAKIVGFFNVQITQGGKSFSQDIVVMENLLAGINTQVNMVFDLKGSDNKKRYVEHSEAGQVLQDGNFLETLLNKPVSLEENERNRLITALQRDTEFLADLMIMDYSLLVVMDNDSKLIHCGIIDYLRKFTWDKRLETIGKSALSRTQPTILPPNEYQKRFCKQIQDYFPIFPSCFQRDEAEESGRSVEAASL